MCHLDSALSYYPTPTGLAGYQAATGDGTMNGSCYRSPYGDSVVLTNLSRARKAILTSLLPLTTVWAVGLANNRPETTSVKNRSSSSAAASLGTLKRPLPSWDSDPFSFDRRNALGGLHLDTLSRRPRASLSMRMRGGRRQYGNTNGTKIKSRIVRIRRPQRIPYWKFSGTFVSRTSTTLQTATRTKPRTNLQPEGLNRVPGCLSIGTTLASCNWWASIAGLSHVRPWVEQAGSSLGAVRVRYSSGHVRLGRSVLAYPSRNHVSNGGGRCRILTEDYKVQNYTLDYLNNRNAK
jgi:hypothetical protein